MITKADTSFTSSSVRVLQAKVTIKKKIVPLIIRRHTSCNVHIRRRTLGARSLDRHDGI